ncbi:response regulator [Marinilactibacillus psychrotolerans]|uniref:KDP operon transcriptional regulatory protein n=1 Tax=Marinilactibacillus psychrotolerans TaxID=191770 RepID=A0AAV3WQV8_9LACT|nr:response regulator transcription factor [Marinilactibacillus psychrotolerans]GEL66753.1 DNA-binding response regulator [Marinilactibacillus psychrotolerans]GEQ35800.1 KDP operon transcriptional regulatory protein [Marinilactibacillus psychrotolerans]SDC32886.1 two-component system, OmpR family, KDP operon response regulator KdpE [Marinilactibacillus psychrotolerans]
MGQLHEKILIVEDDIQIRKFLSYILENESFEYKTASSGKEAMNSLISESIDMVILDLGLPDIDGLEIIKKVREWSEVPIIVVSARDQDQEKAQALDVGADDYLTKPFSATELLARIRVGFRHYYRMSSTKTQSEIEVGHLKINFDKRIVCLKEEPIHITPMEYNLLALFFKNIGKVLTTKFILKEIWGTAYGEDTQALRTMMAGLRRKIEANPAQPQYIITEIGVGYRMIEQ